MEQFVLFTFKIFEMTLNDERKRTLTSREKGKLAKRLGGQSQESKVPKSTMIVRLLNVSSLFIVLKRNFMVLHQGFQLSCPQTVVYINA